VLAIALPDLKTRSDLAGAIVPLLSHEASKAATPSPLLIESLRLLSTLLEQHTGALTVEDGGVDSQSACAEAMANNGAVNIMLDIVNRTRLAREQFTTGGNMRPGMKPRSRRFSVEHSAGVGWECIAESNDLSAMLSEVISACELTLRRLASHPKSAAEFRGHIAPMLAGAPARNSLQILRLLLDHDTQACQDVIVTSRVVPTAVQYFTASLESTEAGVSKQALLLLEVLAQQKCFRDAVKKHAGTQTARLVEVVVPLLPGAEAVNITTSLSKDTKLKRHLKKSGWRPSA